MQALVARTASISTLALAVLPFLALILADAQAAPVRNLAQPASISGSVLTLASR